jgi:hypothetical protein
VGRPILVREDWEGTTHSNTSSVTPTTPTTTIIHPSSTAQSCRVYVGNLSMDVALQDLKDHMHQVGNVLFAEVLTEGDTGQSKGC